MVEWINVKDRLPEENGSTLVCTDRWKVCTARFYAEKKWWNGVLGPHILYWMPLPEIPKEE